MLQVTSRRSEHRVLGAGLRVLPCAACLALGACGAGAPSTETPRPATVSIDAPQADDGGDAGAAVPDRAAGSPGRVPFRFPLADLFAAAERDAELLADLHLLLTGRRVAEGVTYEVTLEVKGGSAAHRSSAKGENLSSVRAGWRTPSGVLDVLRACSEGARSCRVRSPGAFAEPWHEFDLRLTIEHPKWGRHVESREAALVLAPLVEAAFAEGDGGLPVGP